MKQLIIIGLIGMTPMLYAADEYQNRNYYNQNIQPGEQRDYPSRLEIRMRQNDASGDAPSYRSSSQPAYQSRYEEESRYAPSYRSSYQANQPSYQGRYDEERRYTPSYFETQRTTTRVNQVSSPSDSESRDLSFTKDQFKGDGDRKLGEKIREELDDDYQHISLQIVNGDVTIRGTIEDADDKKDIEDTIREVPGVRHVDNQLTIIKKNNN